MIKAVVSPTPGMLTRISKRALEGSIGRQHCSRSCVDGSDLAFDLGEALSRLALEQHRAMHAVPLQGGDPILHQSAPGDDQLLHVVERLAHGWAHGRLEERCKAGEHRSINGISLGVPTSAKRRA